MEKKSLNFRDRIDLKYLSLLSCIGAAISANAPVFSNDAFAAATTAATNATSKLAEVAKVLFPLSIVVCAIILLFSHDERVIKTSWKTMIMICIVYAIIVLVSGDGFAVNTINTILGSGG